MGETMSKSIKDCTGREVYVNDVVLAAIQNPKEGRCFGVIARVHAIKNGRIDMEPLHTSFCDPDTIIVTPQDVYKMDRRTLTTFISKNILEPLNRLNLGVASDKQVSEAEIFKTLCQIRNALTVPPSHRLSK